MTVAELSKLPRLGLASWIDTECDASAWESRDVFHPKSLGSEIANQPLDVIIMYLTTPDRTSQNAGIVKSRREVEDVVVRPYANRTAGRVHLEHVIIIDQTKLLHSLEKVHCVLKGLLRSTRTVFIS